MPFIPPAPANHRNSGVLAATTGLTVNIAEVIGSAWGSGTKVGTVSVSSAGVTELKVGTTGLNGRHTLFVTNDSSILFYIKGTSTLSPTDGILVNSGVSATVKLDQNQNQKLWAISFTGTALIKVMEMKS